METSGSTAPGAELAAVSALALAWIALFALFALGAWALGGALSALPSPHCPARGVQRARIELEAILSERFPAGSESFFLDEECLAEDRSC